jgi:hypothetical protein
LVSKQACSPASSIAASTSASRLLDHLLDARRVDAPVGDQLGEREPGDLAAHRVEARDGDRLGACRR